MYNVLMKGPLLINTSNYSKAIEENKGKFQCCSLPKSTFS